MYISKVHIQNYKSIKDAEIKFNDKLNIFVGKNGAGKTAAFEAIKKLIFKMPYDSFPDYVSLEICDEKQELGKELWSMVNESTIQPGHKRFYKESFISENQKDTLKIKIIGKKGHNKQVTFYVSYEGVFFKDANIYLSETLLLSNKAPTFLDSTKMEIQLSGSEKTLLDFVMSAFEKTDKDHTVMGIATKIEEKIFGFLQKNCFFVSEMRNLQKANTKGIMSKKSTENNESSYMQLQKATIDPSTFIDRLYFFQNTLDNQDEYDVVKCFESMCEADGYEKVQAIESGSDLVLRISEKGKSILLNNTSFPSGRLQKIFFNFVLAISKDGILFFEEPENNLHPGLQKHVFHLLKERKSQVFINTHSSEFVDNTIINAIYKFQINKQGSTQIKRADENTKSNVETFKKYFMVDKRIFFANFVILCEGATEFALFPYLFDEFTSEKEFLHKNNIFLVNLDGEDKRKIYKQILEMFDIPYFIMIDKKKEETTEGYDSNSKTYMFKFKDFDDWYDIGYLQTKNIIKSNSLKKNKLALKVLECWLDQDKEKISKFLNSDAIQDFKYMVDMLKEELIKHIDYYSVEVVEGGGLK